MAGKAKKRAARRKSAGSRRKAQARPKPAAKESTTDRFMNDLLTRGEAAKLDPDGKLPLDATHVITKENEDGTASVRRLRYKLF
jgi:hypothetical protein